MSPALFVIAVLLHLGACSQARLLSRGRARFGFAAAPLLLAAAFASADRLVAEKAVAGLVMPAGLVWLALLASASLHLAAWSRARGAGATQAIRRRAAAACGLFGAFWLATAAPVAGAATSWLERGFERTAAPALPLDAILLLGGGARSSRAGEPELGAAGDRLEKAADLVRRGLARRIVCTGSGLNGAPPGKDTARLLEAMGVAEGQLMVLPGPRTTSEEIAAARKLIARTGWRSVGLVTSAWHMRRALKLARRQGLDLVPLPADHHGDAGDTRNLLEVMPSAQALWDLQIAAWELLGAAVGR